jgi:hypothetical protein
MSNLSLDAYAQDLAADVLATAEAESSTTPETFTRRSLDDLEQAGVTENTFTAYLRAHGIEVSGYGSNDSLGTLDVFISSFRQHPLDYRMNRAEVETLFRRASTFIQRCREGLRHQVDESDDVYDMCLAVEKKLPEASQIRIFLLTNSTTSANTYPDSSLAGIPVSYEIWDLARFHRMATSGTLSEPIVVDFATPVPCLAAPGADRDLSVFLAILPGPTEPPRRCRIMLLSSWPPGLATAPGCWPALRMAALLSPGWESRWRRPTLYDSARHTGLPTWMTGTLTRSRLQHPSPHRDR